MLQNADILISGIVTNLLVLEFGPLIIGGCFYLFLDSISSYISHYFSTSSTSVTVASSLTATPGIFLDPLTTLTADPDPAVLGQL